MDVVLRSVLKAQNHALLVSVAERCQLDTEDLLRKYWTPTFYSVGLNLDSIYEVRELETLHASKKMHRYTRKDRAPRDGC